MMRTARRQSRGQLRPSVKASSTASPMPPSSWWSSTVSRQPVSGTPAEMMHAAEIDADAIVAASRRMVEHALES